MPDPSNRKANPASKRPEQRLAGYSGIMAHRHANIPERFRRQAVGIAGRLKVNRSAPVWRSTGQSTAATA